MSHKHECPVCGADTTDQCQGFIDAFDDEDFCSAARKRRHIRCEGVRCVRFAQAWMHVQQLQDLEEPLKTQDGVIPVEIQEESAWLSYWSAYARGDELGMRLAWKKLRLTGPASMRKITGNYPVSIKEQK